MQGVSGSVGQEHGEGGPERGWRNGRVEGEAPSSSSSPSTSFSLSPPLPPPPTPTPPAPPSPPTPPTPPRPPTPPPPLGTAPIQNRPSKSSSPLLLRDALLLLSLLRAALFLHRAPLAHAPAAAAAAASPPPPPRRGGHGPEVWPGSTCRPAPCRWPAPRPPSSLAMAE